MGLFDRLKKEAVKLVSDVVENALGSSDNGQKQQVNQGSWTSSKTGRMSGEKVLRERLEHILASEWGEYEIRRQVPASEMNAESGACSYSYGVYWGGQPRAMIMVLNNRNHYRKREVVLAQDACRSQGVAYMNFMSYLPNEVEYISQRFRENIQ